MLTFALVGLAAAAMSAPAVAAEPAPATLQGVSAGLCPTAAPPLRWELALGQALANGPVTAPARRPAGELIGLYYFRARYYDPYAGRFLQRDPVWDAGNVGNQYSFVGNNPVNGLDPWGTETLSPGELQALRSGSTAGRAAQTAGTITRTGLPAVGGQSALTGTQWTYSAGRFATGTIRFVGRASVVAGVGMAAYDLYQIGSHSVSAIQAYRGASAQEAQNLARQQQLARESAGRLPAWMRIFQQRHGRLPNAAEIGAFNSASGGEHEKFQQMEAMWAEHEAKQKEPCPTPGGAGQQPPTQPPAPPGTPDPFEENYESFQDAVGQLHGLEGIEVLETRNPGARSQGFTEKWIGRAPDGTWYSAFRNPQTGRFSGGKRSSRND